MRRLTKALFILGLAVGLVSSVWAQRPYGSIQGRVLDQNHKPLGNATVILNGTTLQGFLIYITTANGAYHYLGLLPGTYALRAELPGHKTYIWKDIVLGPGQTFEWNPVLESTAGEELSLEEEVQVSRPSPLVDTRSAAFHTEFDGLLLSTLPTNRDMYDFQNAAPAAVSEDSEFMRTSSILGGTVRSQVYKVDGAFLNDPVDLDLLVNIGPDILETIEIEQAGHPAEAGQAGSSSLNILTRPPVNATTGSVRAYVGGSDFNHPLFSLQEMDKLGKAPANKYSSYWDFSLSLGGPIIEDMLWLYVNARRLTWGRTNPYDPEERMAALSRESSHYDLSYGIWTGFLRAAFQYARVLRYTGSLYFNSIYEPVAFSSATPQASQEYTSILDHGSDLFTTHNLNYLLNQSTFVDVRGTYFYQSVPLHVRNNDISSVYDYTQDVYFGSGPYNEDRKTTRLLGVASITTYWDGFLGSSHELKASFEFEQSERVSDYYKTNQFQTYWYDYANRNPYYYSPALKQGRLSLAPIPAASGTWTPSNGLRRFAGYVQDSLRAGRLALNLGVYIDFSYIYQPSESRSLIQPTKPPDLLASDLTVFNFIKALSQQMEAEGLVFPLAFININSRALAKFFTLSPRLGLVLDLFGNSRTALKASLARYHEPYPLGLYSYDQVLGPSTVDWRWNDLNANGLMDLPGVDSYDLVHYPNQNPTLTTYAKNLKPPYTDEVLLGIEQQLFADFKLGLHFVYKVDKNIIDTIDANNGYDPQATDSIGPIWLPFTFTDPGMDGAFGTGDDQTLTVYGLRKDRPAPSYLIDNIPQAKREYRAAVLSFAKRLSHGWELQGSFTLSSYKGNIGAGFADTNFKSTAFDSPNALVNAYGALFFDRPVQFNLMGTVLLPWDWVLGLHFQAYSGVPWNRTLARVYFPADFGAAYGGVQTPYASVNAETPGSRRYQAYVNLDLHLEKGLRIGGGMRFTLVADVFNVLGRHGQVFYTDPAGTLHYDMLPVTYQPAASFGQLASLYGVRALRIGFRIGV